MKKVVLAYSGGLDTSVCIRYLKEAGYRVIAFCADVGQGQNLTAIRNRAYRCGAARVIVRDLKNLFARGYVLPALQAGAVYEGQYLLATALSRPLIAKTLAEVAKAERAQAVAHGCTGKGNDQVRIEVSLRILHPTIRIIAPVREWPLQSRQEEVAYARARKIPIPKPRESRYSIDQNLWGVSIESGPLEDPWVQPPEEAFQWTRHPAHTPSKASVASIDFAAGVPVKLNGSKRGLVPLIEALNRMGARHGVGRTDLIEDRLIGIKSREVYEAPAAFILHTALRALEQLVLDRETLSFKQSVSQQYARLIYDGLWFTPLKGALDAFVASTVPRLTGSVRLELLRGQARVVGRRSPYSRYAKSLATYEGKDLFDHRAAAGFIQLWGLPYVRKKMD